MTVPASLRDKSGSQHFPVFLVLAATGGPTGSLLLLEARIRLAVPRQADRSLPRRTGAPEASATGRDQASRQPWTGPHWGHR